MENKLNSNFIWKSIIFQAAESELRIREAAMNHKILMLPRIRAKISYQQKLLSIDSCHKKRYQININAHYQGISIELLAIEDYLSQTSELSCKSEMGLKRIYWGVIN